MALESVNYKRDSDFLATCIIEFEEDKENSGRILKNLMRTYDVLDIEVVSEEHLTVP
jgi:hypothetical protein